MHGPECQARESEFYPSNFQMQASEFCAQTELYEKKQKKKNQYKTENEFLMMEQEILSAESVETPKTPGH